MWDAACAGADPELFFPREQDDPANHEAKLVCARCPVKADCLEYSMKTREESGVWGGQDEWDRRTLLDDQRDGDTQGVA